MDRSALARWFVMLHSQATQPPPTHQNECFPCILPWWAVLPFPSIEALPCF